MFTILGGDGKEYGPAAAAKVQEWIAGGRANLQTKARRAGETEWRTLGEFPEFGGAPATPPPAGELPPPPPSAVLDAPVAPAAPELVLADRGTRLAAVILDTILGCLFLGPGAGLLAAAGAFHDAPQGTPNLPLLFAGMCALGIGALILAILQIYLLTTRGQSVGKKVMGIRIVAHDTEENAGFVKAVLLRGFVNGLIGAIPVVGGIYSLVDIFFIFREDRRCIHDLIAGTKVVKA